jgi:hypothetical protein
LCDATLRQRRYVGDPVVGPAELAEFCDGPQAGGRELGEGVVERCERVSDRPDHVEGFGERVEVGRFGGDRGTEFRRKLTLAVSGASSARWHPLSRLCVEVYTTAGTPRSVEPVDDPQTLEDPDAATGALLETHSCRPDLPIHLVPTRGTYATARVWALLDQMLTRPSLQDAARASKALTQAVD